VPPSRGAHGAGATEFWGFPSPTTCAASWRAGHPQANGKTGRPFGALTQKIHLFVDTGESVAWRDTASPRMALNAGEPGAPCGALGRKTAPPGAAAAADEGVV